MVNLAITSVVPTSEALDLIRVLSSTGHVAWAIAVRGHADAASLPRTHHTRRATKELATASNHANANTLR